jgi:hypothetical protein
MTAWETIPTKLEMENGQEVGSRDITVVFIILRTIFLTSCRTKPYHYGSVSASFLYFNEIFCDKNSSYVAANNIQADKSELLHPCEHLR